MKRLRNCQNCHSCVVDPTGWKDIEHGDGGPIERVGLIRCKEGWWDDRRIRYKPGKWSKAAMLKIKAQKCLDYDPIYPLWGEESEVRKHEKKKRAYFAAARPRGYRLELRRVGKG